MRNFRSHAHIVDLAFVTTHRRVCVNGQEATQRLGRPSTRCGVVAERDERLYVGRDGDSSRSKVHLYGFAPARFESSRRSVLQMTDPTWG